MRPLRFHPNYPHTKASSRFLLPTPQRIGALPQFTGQGVVMAFIDAGFYPHPDIAGRIVLHVDASTDKMMTLPAVTNFTLYSWHGQMTSAIACGDGRLSGGKYRGVASSAELVLIKVSTPDMRIKEGDILRGLQWVLDNHAKYHIRIVNVSVGGDEVNLSHDHPLHVVVRCLAQEGVVVVIAAGNSGTRHLLPPASASEAIVVGGYDDANSMDRHEWVDYPNNFGYAHDLTTKPDLIAPARWIASPLLPETVVNEQAEWLMGLLDDNPTFAMNRILSEGREVFPEIIEDETHFPTDKVVKYLQGKINEYKLIHRAYQHVDGTSVAAPIVSSVIAQMLEANPSLTPERVRMILRQTARPLRGIPPIKQGAGMLEPVKAVNSAIGIW